MIENISDLRKLRAKNSIVRTTNCNCCNSKITKRFEYTLKIEFLDYYGHCIDNRKYKIYYDNFYEKIGICTGTGKPFNEAVEQLIEILEEKEEYKSFFRDE